jgi:outer membrane immunogenic protein
LLYFQGGGAARNSDVQLFNPAGVQVGEVNKTRTGWTVGAGSEYKFAPNWSWFVEYDYANFGNNGVQIPVAGVGTFSGNVKTDAHMVLTGVNWRF